MATAVTERAGAGAPPPDGDVACHHCGLPVPAALFEPGADAQYCCTGCRTAAAMIRAAGLDGYYRLPERRDAAVSPTGKAYDEFDHETFHALHVRRRDDGLAEVEFLLEGVHCASCVWLVERVPLILPGVQRAELDVQRALAQVTWDPVAVPLSTIARALDQLGYAPHPYRGANREAVRRGEERKMLVQIGVAGAIAGNVMLLAMALYGGWFSGIEREYEQLFRWLSLALTLPAFLGPGRTFLRGAWASWRTRTLHMDVPVAIALTAGMARGAANTISGTGPIYFDGVAMLIFLLLAGRFLQYRGQRAAADAAELQASLTPASARVVEPDGAIRDVPTQALLPGMRLDVRAGDVFAADGVVEDGRSALDCSLLTGESRSVAAAPGAAVFAGTLNVDAPLRVRVTAAGSASRLGALLAQLDESAKRRAPIVQLADRLSGWFVAAVLVLAVGTWVYWAPRDPANALDHAIALLIVTCPCALALATPLAISVATGRAAAHGILVKGGDVLEALARPGTLVLDKTGTITEGRARLVAFDGPADVRPLVLALERHANHPVADAFRRAWADLDAPEARGVRHVPGAGILGVVDGRHVVVGSRAWVASQATGSPPVGDGADDGTSRVWVAVDGAVVAEARLGDPVRPDAARAVARLRARGWDVRVLSGDEPDAVRAAARAVGIGNDAVEGGASPERKLAVLRDLAARGHAVMVGDGVNDAAAMAASTVGVAVHGGAEASLAAADVYLARPGLAPLVQLAEGAGRTLTLIRRNVMVSLAYNVVGATLAVTGLIDPLVAAVMMPVSSLTVVLTSWRGRTFIGERRDG